LQKFSEGEAPFPFIPLFSPSIDDGWMKFLDQEEDGWKATLNEFALTLAKASNSAESKEAEAAESTWDLVQGVLKDLASSKKATDAGPFKGRLVQMIAEFEDKVSGAPISVTGAMRKRSDAMHMTAQKSEATGLWKVGNEHIQEMKEAATAFKQQRRYEILSEAEFEADYLPWNPKPDQGFLGFF
jgi:hypothetical protein